MTDDPYHGLPSDCEPQSLSAETTARIRMAHAMETTPRIERPRSHLVEAVCIVFAVAVIAAWFLVAL